MAFTCSDILKIVYVAFSIPPRTVSRSGRDIVSFSHVNVYPSSFAVILPPLGVFLERGCGADLAINM